jgi:hypothetical protein
VLEYLRARDLIWRETRISRAIHGLERKRKIKVRHDVIGGSRFESHLVSGNRPDSMSQVGIRILSSVSVCELKQKKVKFEFLRREILKLTQSVRRSLQPLRVDPEPELEPIQLRSKLVPC